MQTRVLVTHGITYLPKVDLIITMQNGKVSEVGTYDDLIKNDGAFADFIQTYLNENENDDQDSDSKYLVILLTMNICDNRVLFPVVSLVEWLRY